MTCHARITQACVGGVNDGFGDSRIEIASISFNGRGGLFGRWETTGGVALST